MTGRLESTHQQAIIALDGTVNVPPVGAIAVSDLTLLDAHRVIAERARALFRFADVSVTVLSPRAFEVLLAGELQRPGSVLATATRRVQDVILAAGGVTPGGSLRRIVLTRKGVARTIDLLAFELRGDVQENPPVQEGMSVYVPVDLHQLLVDKDETQNIVLENGDVLTLPVVEDKVYVVGAVRTPRAVDLAEAPFLYITGPVDT